MSQVKNNNCSGSYSEQQNQPLKSKNKGIYFLKMENNLETSPLYSSEMISSYENKLPVNLFHNATQYNKMLITNGKSIRKKSEQQNIDGYIQNLEFINDNIFQSRKQKRSSLKKKISTSDRKQVNQFTQECQCCCCDQYCSMCFNQNKCKKQSVNNAIQQNKEVVVQQAAKVKKSNNKSTNKKRNKKKVITSNKQIFAESMDFGKKVGNRKGSEIQCSSSYLSHKGFNIQNLICSSLIKFQQNKRQNKLIKQLEKQKQYNMKKILKDFEKDTRLRNRSTSANFVKEKKLSPSKSRVRMSYWKAVKDHISNQLKKDAIYGIPKKPFSDDKNILKCDHKSKLTMQMIIQLKMMHQEEALRVIAQEKQDAKVKELIKKQNLKSLEKARKKSINSCLKKKFKPTEEMMEIAFLNLQ